MEVLDYNKNAIYDYSQNQVRKDNRFAMANSMPLKQQAQKYTEFNQPSSANNVGCTVSYPLGALQQNGNDIIDQPYVNYMQNGGGAQVQLSGNKFINQGSVGYGNNQNLFGMNNASIPNQNQKVEGFSNNHHPEKNAMNYAHRPDYANNRQIPTNDPTSDTLLDMKSRPMTDFVHNNMVPFYGGSVKQNMAGTGVASGNFTLGKDVDAGFDHTTPFRDKLNTFTGIDDTYLHKRESGPLFSPAEQQSGWVYGTPAFRPDLERYKQDMFKTSRFSTM